MAAATATGTALVRARDGALVASSCEVARTFASRALGLMGRRGLAPGSGLWIEPCSSIHMMFVRFPIDVVWLSDAGEVLKVSARVRPWIGLAWCGGARTAVELEAGAAENSKLVPGDRLELRGQGA